MHTLVIFGLGLGTVAGVAHTYGLLRRRQRHGAVFSGSGLTSAAYVATWTLGLWMLFGTYVLSLWLLAALVYIGSRLKQVWRPAAR